LNVKS